MAEKCRYRTQPVEIGTASPVNLRVSTIFAEFVAEKIIILKFTVNAEIEEEVDILKMEKLGQLQQIKQIYNFLTTHNLEEISKKLGLGKRQSDYLKWGVYCFVFILLHAEPALHVCK